MTNLTYVAIHNMDFLDALHPIEQVCIDSTHRTRRQSEMYMQTGDIGEVFFWDMTVFPQLERRQSKKKKKKMPALVFPLNISGVVEVGRDVLLPD